MPRLAPNTTVGRGIPPKVPNDSRMGTPESSRVIAKNTRPNHCPNTMDRGRVGVVRDTSQVLGSDSRVIAPAMKVGIRTKLDKICSLTNEAIQFALVAASSRVEPPENCPSVSRKRVTTHKSMSAEDRAQVGPRRRPAVSMILIATGLRSQRGSLSGRTGPFYSLNRDARFAGHVDRMNPSQASHARFGVNICCFTALIAHEIWGNPSF